MFLNRIVETKHEEAILLKELLNKEEALKRIAEMPPCRSLKTALTRSRHREVGLIAEVKKASPSKGLIREDFYPTEIAKEYALAGADALSVLTDVQYFQGSIEIFQEVRAAVDLPLLRKDFMICEEQLIEARLIGADAVLLIAAILDDRTLQRLFVIAQQLGMEALVEVHDEDELQRVSRLPGISIIGINNRNLHTFVTDIQQTARLRDQVPEGVVLVSESGIHLPEQMADLRDQRVDAVLIGEHFMRQEHAGQAIHDLMRDLEPVHP